MFSAEMSAIQAIAVRSWFITALVWATIIGYLLWRDIPPLEVWLGAGIIIGCDLYVIQRESLRCKSPALAPVHSHPLP